MATNSLALPDKLIELISAAEARNGLPAGTMFSVMRQEGDQRFIADPTRPHYPTGVAPNGKKSSAFGPFGILESTARDPGYGVVPLKDKSIEEQVRFAADYLGGRVRAAGGDLAKGLAGYGEGQGYAQEVLARMGGVGNGPGRRPVTMVAAVPAPVQAPQVPEVPAKVLPPLQPAPAVVAGPVMPAPADPEKDPWTLMRRQIDAAMAAQFKPEDLNYTPARKAVIDPFADMTPTGPEEYRALLAADLANKPGFGGGKNRLGRRTA